MARYEAHLQCPGLELASFQQQLNGVAQAVGAELNWLDKRNATIALLFQPHGISVRLLFEFRGHGDITCLLSSREGMGKGAPQTLACFERVLALLSQQLPAPQLRYRSDRDGPVKQR
jgi:hypothetical protein